MRWRRSMMATLDAKDKNIVVIGGGDTAMDCVRTAVRQGAKSVKCLYRRDRENMPGSQREVSNAEEEGVEFVWLSGPKSFDGTKAKGSSVKQVQASKMRLGAPDASGRRAPEAHPKGEFALDADMVITALGFEAEDLPKLFGAPELGVTRWGTVRVDHKTMMTNLDGVFAVGDIVRGASLVVWAIKDGRDVLETMHKWMRAEGGNRKGSSMKILQNFRHSREGGSPSPTIFGNRKRRRWIPAFAGMTMLCLSPVQAQEEVLEAEAATSTTETSIDPARLAAAKITVDHLFPLGTYERMMKGTIDQLMDSMLGGIAGITIGDMASVSGDSGDEMTEGEKAKSLGDVASDVDPHFEDRMKISTKVMMDEMVALMITMEPAIRTALTNIYARKYTAPQLAEMNNFFATETGGAFARDYMLVFADPEMIQSMMAMMPEIMGAMPEIMKKVEEATAHLPPAPQDAGEDDEAPLETAQ